MKTLLTRPLLAALSLPLAAQASFSTFGTGCPFNGQTPAIGSSNLPQLGTNFGFTYSGPNFTFSSGQQVAQPILALGLAAQPGPVTLPTTLLPQQPAGCDALIVPQVFITTAPDPNGRPIYDTNIPFPIPNRPQLLGATLFAQWVVVVQQCGFAGCGLSAILLSDAGIAVVGP